MNLLRLTLQRCAPPQNSHVHSGFSSACALYCLHSSQFMDRFLEVNEDMYCEVSGVAVNGQYTNNAMVNAVGVDDGTAITAANSSHYFEFNPLLGTLCSTTAGSIGCAQALANGTQIMSTIPIAGCTAITDVNLGLSLDYTTYVGDLLIKLTSPSGTTVTMLNSPLNGRGNCPLDNVRTLLDDASVAGYVDAQCRNTTPQAIFGIFRDPVRHWPPLMVKQAMGFGRCA